VDRVLAGKPEGKTCSCVPFHILQSSTYSQSSRADCEVSSRSSFSRDSTPPAYVRASLALVAAWPARASVRAERALSSETCVPEFARRSEETPGF
jgi:hypothetical protein